jgi:hypothetical protein
VRSPDLSHEHGAVVGFDVGTAGNLIAEHGQIIRDDRVDLVIAPRSAKLFLIGQSIHLGKGFCATRGVGKRPISKSISKSRHETPVIFTIPPDQPPPS